MLNYSLRRVSSTLLTIVVASLVVFAMLRFAPGDPAVIIAGPDASPESIAAVRHELGLDRPLPVQYGSWIYDVVRGDLGRSYISRAEIATLIGRAAGNTVELAVAALALAALIGGVSGIDMAVTRSRWRSTFWMTFNTLSLAIPTFVSGVGLVLLFAIGLRLLPPGGHVSLLRDPGVGLRFLVLPALCLAFPISAVIARFLSSGLRQALAGEYVRTAVAKGLAPARITMRHVLPNALPSVITVVGVQTGQLIGGAVIVEAIFAWPGLGQLIVQATLNRDYLIVQDLILLAVVVFVVMETLADVFTAALDPRLRLR